MLPHARLLDRSAAIGGIAGELRAAIAPRGAITALVESRRSRAADHRRVYDA
jgi:hypothetical protein